MSRAVPKAFAAGRARRRARAALLLLALAAACASVSRFDRAYDERRWTDAAAELQADSALLRDERTLFRAGVLHGTPGRPTFDPARSRMLLTQLLERYPSTAHRAEAAERLAIVNEILRTRASSMTLDSLIVALRRDLARTRSQLDTARSRQDSLRGVAARMEEELRALRSELEQLKAIDLRRRP